MGPARCPPLWGIPPHTERPAPLADGSERRAPPSLQALPGPTDGDSRWVWSTGATVGHSSLPPGVSASALGVIVSLSSAWLPHEGQGRAPKDEIPRVLLKGVLASLHRVLRPGRKYEATLRVQGSKGELRDRTGDSQAGDAEEVQPPLGQLCECALGLARGLKPKVAPILAPLKN